MPMTASASRFQCDCKNSGTVQAKEVVQVYIRPLNPAVYRPYHELKAFAKVSLQPGQIETVTFHSTEQDFAFYGIGIQYWIVEDGITFEAAEIYN
jgi:beta-glucosidase